MDATETTSHDRGDETSSSMLEATGVPLLVEEAADEADQLAPRPDLHSQPTIDDHDMDDESRRTQELPYDQELSHGINEQMNLFWGAVSSAFAEPAGEDVHLPENQHVEMEGVTDIPGEELKEAAEGQEPEREPVLEAVTDVLPDTLEAAQNEREPELHTLMETTKDSDGLDHPRNEWEHVQLLMSLGGQLGQDLAVLDGVPISESDTRFNEVNGESPMEPGRDSDPVQAAPSKRGKPAARGRAKKPKASEEINAEAGPSRLPDNPGPAETAAPTRKRGRATRTTSDLATTNPTPKSDPKPPRKPRRTATNGIQGTGRAILTAAERRANHVSSEKRRRNAIRIGYAELGALEHMSVNGFWPLTGDLEAVIEESKDMEGMEELTGRKRARRESVIGANGTGTTAEEVVGEDDLNLTLANGGAVTTTTKARPRKGIYVVNQGMTSKSAILRKGAALAQWLTEGNEWLRSEVDRLERLLDVSPDQILEECEPEPVVAETSGMERHLMMDGHDGHPGDPSEHHDPHHHLHPPHQHELEQALRFADDAHMGSDHHEHDQTHGHHDSGQGHDHHELDPNRLGQAHDLAMAHHGETTIEDHFIQAVAALRPATEELGPDGYPRDMF
jgi:hypothetical protein